MGNVLSDEKKQQVLALGRLGWPLRRIEEATGIRRETASSYLKAAGIAVRPPGRWGHESVKTGQTVSTDSDSNPAKGCPPTLEPVPYPGRSPTASACEAHRDFIELSLTLCRNAMAIYQDLVDDHGFTARYASVKRFVRALRGRAVPEASGIIVTAPGEEGQVDYGEGPMVRDPVSGKYRRARLFVFTLGYSRKSVRLLSFQSSSKIWAQLHETAFRRLGGAPRVMVLDNLKEGVLKPDFYDPALNPLYRDVLAHYGVVALPCRVRDPDRKGKVESGVGHAQRTPLKGLRFETLAAAQEYLDHWESRWADTRIHGTTKRQVSVMFAEEKPLLLALPIEPFRYYSFGERTVHLDNHIEVEAAYYSAPPTHIGLRVLVQWDEIHVRILNAKTGQLLREHLRKKRGGHQTHREDQPARTPQTTQALLQRAKIAGKNIGALCAEIHRVDGQVGVRRILGVLSLTKKSGAVAADDACAAALEMGVPTYRVVRRYLDRKTPVQLTLRQVDPLIRELTHYRDIVDRMTNKKEPE